MPTIYSDSEIAARLKTQIYGSSNGSAQAVATDSSGNLLLKLTDSANIPLPISTTAFGELRVAELTSVAGWNFNYNVNADLITTNLTGNGTVTSSNSKAVLQTTANAASSAKINTKNTIVYSPGLGCTMRFTAIFTPGVANSSQVIGAGDDVDGFFFGYNGATFGILRRQNGSANWIAQSSWNIDKFDGTGTSGVTLDTTKGNVYSITYQWLGFGMIRFAIENPATGARSLVHQIQYANANTDPSVFNPSFPVMAQVINTTNASNITLQTASAMAFVEGKQAVQTYPLANPNSINSNKSSITTEIALVTIRNNSTYKSKTNRTPVLINLISAATDGTKSANIYVKKNVTLGGTPSYIDINSNTSVVSYDTAGTTVTGGKTLLSFQLAKIDTAQLLTRSMDLFVQPGETLTISATSAASLSCDVSLNWQELF